MGRSFPFAPVGCSSSTAGSYSQDSKLPSDLIVSYRLSFETRRIIGNDMKIGGYASAISLVILDFKSKFNHASELFDMLTSSDLQSLRLCLPSRR